VAQAERYKQSVHSKPNADDPDTQINATCVTAPTRTPSSGLTAAAADRAPGA
jgi:hypothetical protein